MTTVTAKALHGAATVLTVRDIQDSVAYYRDVLGFDVTFVYGEPTFYAGLCRDDVQIHLSSLDKRQPGQGAINIFVEDVDALYEQFKARGARLVNAPKNYDYGMRDFDLLDLDGNQLCFGMGTSAEK